MEEVKTEEIVEEVQQEEVKEVAEKSIEDIIDMVIDKVFAKLAEKKTVVLNSAVSGETGRETPDKRVDFSKLSYSELCAFLENNRQAGFVLPS